MSPTEVSLTAAAPVLQLYFRALSGRSTTMVAHEDDGHVRQRPDSDTTMHLPGRCGLWPERAMNRDWYKVAVTHRALHHALGTFELTPDPPVPAPPGGSHLERFLAQFPSPSLATQVLGILEDARIDYLAKRMFPGLRAAYTRVQEQALAERPLPTRLPPRSAVAEALVQFSLGRRDLLVDDPVVAAAVTVGAAVARCMSPEATVRTSAEQTVTAYTALARLPNIAAGDASPVPVSIDAVAGHHDPPGRVMPSAQLRLEGGHVLELDVSPVGYRDVVGPRYLGQRASGFPVRETILRFTDAVDADGDPDEHQHQGDHHDHEHGHGHGHRGPDQAAEPSAADPDAAIRAGPPKPLPHEHGPPIANPVRLAEGPLRPDQPQDAVYPEWDHVSWSYLADWCRVREKRLSRAEGAETFYRRVLATHGPLVSRLVGSLTRMTPSGRERETLLPRGDDYDLDAAVEALVDLRIGLPPSDRIYSAWTRRRRDVAAVLAIDLSSSTAERISAPRAASRRIVDVEKDAAALLIAALERIGDSYGCYGFSGTGRAKVELEVVKEFAQPLRTTALRALAGLRPMHTTRMGPVIRHLTAKLVRQERPTRLLLIVSDGRPYDLDYGQRYGEDRALDYALADTARALEEARRLGVRPLLVTVDPAGDDYLRSMCDATEYRVIKDIHQLPTALVTLYATARSQV